MSLYPDNPIFNSHHGGDQVGYLFCQCLSGERSYHRPRRRIIQIAESAPAGHCDNGERDNSDLEERAALLATPVSARYDYRQVLPSAQNRTSGVKAAPRKPLISEVQMRVAEKLFWAKRGLPVSQGFKDQFWFKKAA